LTCNQQFKLALRVPGQAQAEPTDCTCAKHEPDAHPARTKIRTPSRHAGLLARTRRCQRPRLDPHVQARGKCSRPPGLFPALPSSTQRRTAAPPRALEPLPRWRASDYRSLRPKWPSL
jgi:hypothetical protein